MDTVGVDSAHRGPNAGDQLGSDSGAESDLGLQVWRRHISPGLIAHTQSSRIWRQATQVGQVPLVSHVAARFGTGGSDFRAWDSLPFVMAKRAPRILARTISAAGSFLPRPPIQETSELQADITMPPHVISSDRQGDSTAISHKRGKQAPPTNGSLIVLRRQSGPAAPERLPLPGQSDGTTLVRSIAERPETADVSPTGHGDQASPATSEGLPFLRRSDGTTFDQSIAARSEATARSSADHGDQALHGDHGDLEGETASDHQQVADGALQISPTYQAGDPQRTAQGPDTKAGIVVTPALRNVAPGAILLRSRHQSSPTTGDTAVAMGGSAIRSDKNRREGETDHIPVALQPPIVRRVLRREAVPVSQKSGDSHQSADGSDEHLPPLVQTKSAGRSASDDSEMVLRADEPLLVRREQSKPLDTLCTSLSSDRPYLLRALPAVSPTTPRYSYGGTHADVQGEGSSIDPILWRFTSALPDARHTETSSMQRGPAGPSNKGGSLTEGVLSDPVSSVPLVQVTDRPLPRFDSPTILWRSAIPGITKDTRLIEGYNGHEAVSGSINHASSPPIARAMAHPPGSYVSRPNPSPMNGPPTPAESSHASPSVNVAELAEQVGRFLTKQLTVERERRGVSL